MKIEYVTGNPGKFREAQLVLNHWQLEQVDLEIPEIQGEPAEVLIAKARSALAILERPLIVEDVSIHCEALNGLPGPYIKDFMRKLGDTGFYDLIRRYDNHNVKAVCIVGFIKPGTDPVLFEGTMMGRLVAPRGTLKHGKYAWNRIFQLDGYEQTLGEMTLEDASRISARSQALNKLRAYLESHENELATG